MTQVAGVVDGDGLTDALADTDGDTVGESTGGGARPTKVQLALKTTPPVLVTADSVAFERL